MSNGWRPLVLFWALILGLGAAGAVALQIMGPPAPVMAPGAAASTPSAPLAAIPPEQPSPGLSRTPVAEMLEPAPDFPGRFLPRRAQDGRVSMIYYARAADVTDKRPRVAMLVVGLGQSAADTISADAALPGAVSLGFSPYAVNPDPLLADAREHGHEYLVTLPMESQGYPLNDSGPHALLTGADATTNDKNLEWVLSRMQGEVGLTGASDGLRGERYATATALFDRVLSQLRTRGLLYVDPRPTAAAPADGAVVSMVVDDPPDRASIDAKLSQLEQRARDGETVLGLAGPLRPVTVERIAAWARGLDSRGVTLVPVSALVQPK